MAKNARRVRSLLGVEKTEVGNMAAAMTARLEHATAAISRGADPRQAWTSATDYASRLYGVGVKALWAEVRRRAQVSVRASKPPPLVVAERPREPWTVVDERRDPRFPRARSPSATE